MINPENFSFPKIYGIYFAKIMTELKLVFAKLKTQDHLKKLQTTKCRVQGRRNKLTRKK